MAQRLTESQNNLTRQQSPAPLPQYFQTHRSLPDAQATSDYSSFGGYGPASPLHPLYDTGIPLTARSSDVGYAQVVQDVPISHRSRTSFSRTHHSSYSADFPRIVHSSYIPTPTSTAAAWDAQQQSSCGYGQLPPSYHGQRWQSSQQHLPSPSALYLDAAGATDELNHKLNILSPTSGAFSDIDVDVIVELLEVCKQQFSENAEAMKELYRQRQTMTAKPSTRHSAVLPIPNGDALPSSTELGFSGSKIDAFQYHAALSIGMDILQHADTQGALGPPVYRFMTVTGQQASPTLSHNPQTSMTEIGEESLPYREVASYHDKRTTPFTSADATSPQSTNLDYGPAQEIAFDSASSCIPRQPPGPAALIGTSGNKDGHAKSSVTPPHRDGPTVLSFMLGGINHYRCECGFENTRKGALDRHLESLHHSEWKYECSCSKKFTRHNSLNRHRKRCEVNGVKG